MEWGELADFDGVVGGAGDGGEEVDGEGGEEEGSLDHAGVSLSGRDFRGDEELGPAAFI